MASVLKGFYGSFPIWERTGGREIAEEDDDAQCSLGGPQHSVAQAQNENNCSLQKPPGSIGTVRFTGFSKNRPVRRSDCIGGLLSEPDRLRLWFAVFSVGPSVRSGLNNYVLYPSPFYMWALVVSFSLSWTKLLVSQDSALFWLGPRSLSSSRVWSLGFLESCLLHCMTSTGLQGLVMRCLMNLSRKSSFQH
jgi:hypothetical protein